MANHTPLPWGVEPKDPAYLVLGGEVVGMLAPGCASKEEAVANADVVVLAVNSFKTTLTALRTTEAEIVTALPYLRGPFRKNFESLLGIVRTAIDAAIGGRK